MSVSTGAFGETVIEIDGSTNGMQRRIMRPKLPPYIMVEVIDGGGTVSAQRCSRDVYWREHLEGQGGDPAERAAKGRKNANRIVVAVLEGGPGALAGERLQAERRKHGYEVIPNVYGMHNVYEGQVQVRDKNTGSLVKIEGCGRGIKVLDPKSPIAERRAASAEELRARRGARMAQNMDTAQAAAAILNQGLRQEPAQGAISAVEASALMQRMAKLESELAAAKAAPAPEAIDADDDAPAPSPRKGK